MRLLQVLQVLRHPLLGVFLRQSMVPDVLTDQTFSAAVACGNSETFSHIHKSVSPSCVLSIQARAGHPRGMILTLRSGSETEAELENSYATCIN